MSYLSSHWSLAWAVIVVCTGAVAVHLTGLRRMTAARRAAGRPAGMEHLLREAAAFYSAVATVLLAVVSPMGYWSGVFVWVRSVQDLLLAVVAPALIVLGAPWLPLSRGLRRAPQRRAGLPAGPGSGPDMPPPGRTAWWLAWPVGATVAFSVVWLGWHVPALYDHAVTSAAVRYAEYLSYLGAGVLLWLQLIGSRPSSPVSPPLRRLKFLIATVVADTVLGMVLVFGSGLLYPAYLNSRHHTLSVVADQQVGGAVLWMGILPPLIVAAVALLASWLEQEETEDLSRDLDRLTGQRAVGWASGKGMSQAGRPSGLGHRLP